jgi:hypothetical protein
MPPALDQRIVLTLTKREAAGGMEATMTPANKSIYAQKLVNFSFFYHLGLARSRCRRAKRIGHAPFIGIAVPEPLRHALGRGLRTGRQAG